VVLRDTNSSHVDSLAHSRGVAAIHIGFGSCRKTVGKGPILVPGLLSLRVSLLIQPDLEEVDIAFNHGVCLSGMDAPLLAEP
jgi:hypothetical protein